MTQSLQLTRPDDWHLHLRDGEALAVTVPATARAFSRAVVMPNLNPPVTTVAQAEAYRARILEALPSGSSFEPLMTLYLTDVTSADELRRAADSDFVHACKYYPAGATTNSEGGVTAIERLNPSLEVMEEVGLPLLVHGEVTTEDIDIFDREHVFIDRVLTSLVERFPKLKVVFEHITTKEAAQFVTDAREGVAATITPQHLLMNRNDLLVGGIKPHHYCLPVLKRATHQGALQIAALSGNPRFFLGTDSAPHAKDTKENACGCAGCYSAPFALPLYAGFFEAAGELDLLEGFASHHGADFYGLPRNESKVTLVREMEFVPDELEFLHGKPIVPYWAGREVHWKLVD